MDFMEREFKDVLKEWSLERGNVIPLLQKTQEIYGYLPREAMEEIGRITGKSGAEIYGVATFYAQFRFEPIGKHVIKVCHGTACHVSGAEMLDQTIENELAVNPGQTTKDMKFTVERVACLGCCSLAPVVMIDGEVYGKLNGDKLKKILKKFKED